jgi:hypothetical protein
MEKLVIRILDKKAVKRLNEMATKKLIEIHQEPELKTVDWSIYIGSLPKMPLSELEKEINSFRNWG